MNGVVHTSACYRLSRTQNFTDFDFRGTTTTKTTTTTMTMTTTRQQPGQQQPQRQQQQHRQQPEVNSFLVVAHSGPYHPVPVFAPASGDLVAI